MISHQEPLAARRWKQAARAAPAHAPQVTEQNGHCPGAAAQLAAVHRTLRHGPVLQLQPGGVAGRARSGAEPAPAPNHTGLPDRLKGGVEALSGVSLDGVKVHYSSPKPAQLNAHAYAQGRDIHLAPGQERHLPHEAWHVVQQARGRVKPTLQMKDGVPINDEAGLEREAETMGARAAALPFEPGRPAPVSSSSPPGCVVQGYFIRREPTAGALFSISDDKRIVTGMGTPNHELYVDNAAGILAINDAAKQSMLKFTPGGDQTLFGKKFIKVNAGFKTVSFEGPPTGFFGTTKRTVDLDKEYREMVAPAIKAESGKKFAQIIDQIPGLDWAEHFSLIKNSLQELMPELELFKKLVIANQATEHYHDVVNAMDPPLRLIKAIETIVYSKAALKSEVEDAQERILFEAHMMQHPFHDDRNLLDVLGKLILYWVQLLKAMPEDLKVDLMLVHSVNYQESMLLSIEKKDPMFYRACDVMASTILGNKITEQNKDQLKVYAAGGTSGSRHFATKILKSGGDWVTLESFAAGEREEAVLGLTDENRNKNLDNSWQYMMYGSLAKKDKSGNEEDNAFELYTKLRYFLKGIEEPGVFRTTTRDRFTSQIRKDAFTTIPGIDDAKSVEIWERLFRSAVFDHMGQVKNPDYLEADYIALRLDRLDRPRAAAISARLKSIYRTPRTAERQIQGHASSEFRNILGWIELTGLPIDAVKLGDKVGDALAKGKDPVAVQNAAWIRYMLAMEKRK